MNLKRENKWITCCEHRSIVKKTFISLYFRENRFFYRLSTKYRLSDKSSKIQRIKLKHRPDIHLKSTVLKVTSFTTAMIFHRSKMHNTKRSVLNFYNLKHSLNNYWKISSDRQIFDTASYSSFLSYRSIELRETFNHIFAWKKNWKNDKWKRKKKFFKKNFFFKMNSKIYSSPGKILVVDPQSNDRMRYGKLKQFTS